MSEITKINRDHWKYTCINCGKKRSTVLEERAKKGICGKCRAGRIPIKGQIDIEGQVAR